jgi:hypothetical protein
MFRCLKLNDQVIEGGPDRMAYVSARSWQQLSRLTSGRPES